MTLQSHIPDFGKDGIACFIFDNNNFVGRMSSRCLSIQGEESPGFTGRECRLTAGGGNSKDSATEIYRHFCGKGGKVV